MFIFKNGYNTTLLIPNNVFFAEKQVIQDIKDDLNDFINKYKESTIYNYNIDPKIIFSIINLALNNHLKKINSNKKNRKKQTKGVNTLVDETEKQHRINIKIIDNVLCFYLHVKIIYYSIITDIDFLILYNLFKSEIDIIDPLQTVINDIFEVYKNKYDFIDPYNFLHKIVFKDNTFLDTLNQIKPLLVEYINKNSNTKIILPLI